VAMPIMVGYNNKLIEPFYTKVYLSEIPNLISDALNNELKDIYQTRDLCGACFALKLSHYRDQVLFDELFQMYYEDGDLARRLLANGHGIIIVPKSVFHHAHANTNDEIQTIQKRGVQRSSQLLFQLKYNPGRLSRNIIAIGFLFFQNIITLIVSLRFRELAIEVMAFFLVFKKLKRLNESKRTPLQTY
jgi:GT2 family glycosyltransferase